MYPLEGWLVLLVLGIVCLFVFALFELAKIRERKCFKSFFGVNPPQKREKKMISFMQVRVNNVLSSLAQNIPQAILKEEEFLKSRKKDTFDMSIYDREECKKIEAEYVAICVEIERTKKIFWKLHKIVKFYGFATKDSFKDYLPK